MNVAAEAAIAAVRIAPHVRETPVERSPALEDASGGEVHLKLENLQRTGSFKLRGAMNTLLSLDESERARGVVAASSGNHGAGVACGASAAGADATIFVPDVVVDAKVEMIRGYGGTVRREGADCVLTEAAARRYADERDLAYISPYNDPRIVAGQGTVGVEMTRQIEHLDAVFVSTGGGGLISGVGHTLRAAFPDIEVIACSAANSCVMHRSLEAGEMLDLPSDPTLSDGTAGGVESDTMTFELCRAVITESLIVSEEEIASAMRLVISKHHTLIEGAAGVAVAAFRKVAPRFRDKSVAILLCGANVAPETLKEIL